MHELGIVFYIIRDAKEAALQNSVKHISKVVMNIGEVSTVIPDLLQDCWKWAVAKEEMMTGCELVVNRIPAINHCNSCQKRYSAVEHGRTCPDCGSEDTWLEQGNEVEIKEIEVTE